MTPRRLSAIAPTLPNVIALSHYGSENDISGVTSWLQALLTDLQDESVRCALHLHHFGEDPGRGSLVTAMTGSGLRLDAVPMPPDTVAAVRETLRFLNHTEARVFVPQCLPSMVFAARIAAGRGVPFALTLHADDPEYWGIFDACAPGRKEGIVVAVSEAIASAARRRRPECDVRVIPCGVSVGHEPARWDGARFRVAFCGRMVEEQKRVTLVLDTLVRFCRSTPHGEAVMIGDGPALRDLRARVSAAGLDDRIRFTGRLPPEQVPGALGGAHAVLLMSDYEGLPLAMLEGMAQGLVPVARAIRSGIPEIVREGETGLLVTEDPVVAAAALSSLARDPERWQALSQAARFLVEASYSQRSCLARWRQLLVELESLSRPRYPIPVSARPSLPRFDPRLARLDRRPPTLAARCLATVRRLAAMP